MRPPGQTGSPAPAAAPAPDRTSWSAVAVVVLVGVLAAAHVGKLPPALPLIRADLGMGLVAAGVAIALFSVLGMTVAVLLGGLADRLGRRTMIPAGFAALALGGALGALAGGTAPLMASRVIEGVGFIAVSVALPAVAFAAAARRDRPFVLALWSVYTPLGMALAMLAAPLAIEALGWRGMWWAIVALCPVAMVAILRAMRGLDLPRASQTPLAALAARALSCRAFLVTALTFLGYAFQWVTLMVWLPTFLTEALGASLERAAIATALVVLVNVPGCLVGGWLLRRGARPRRLVLAGGAAMGALALGVFLPVLPDAVRLVLCAGFSFIGGLIPPSLFNNIPRVAPAADLVGAGNGLLMQGSATGQAIGAPLVALAVSRAGGDWAYALVPMLAACVLTLGAGALATRPDNA